MEEERDADGEEERDIMLQDGGGGGGGGASHGFIVERWRCSVHPATLGRGALGFDSIPGPS